MDVSGGRSSYLQRTWLDHQHRRASTVRAASLVWRIGRSRYRFVVSNPEHLASHRVADRWRHIDPAAIPLVDDGEEHLVSVLLGSESTLPGRHRPAPGVTADEPLFTLWLPTCVAVRIVAIRAPGQWLKWITESLLRRKRSRRSVASSQTSAAA